MLWVLVKKQLAEVFKGYFYDAKKNKLRPKGAIAAYFLLFIVVMVGMLGGMFTTLSLSLCGALSGAGLGWLYFVLMGGVAVALGAFGSVFNSYAALYLAKDNDLLLSLPIPVRTIVAARLVNVYLMGTMYSATAIVPTIVVYWITTGATAARVIGGVLLFVIVTVIVLLLSCLLGWVVAKISRRLKNKSFVTVLLSLLFIAAYYFFYFKANDLLRDLLLHAEAYGEKIKGAAYGLYLFGRVGEGDWVAAFLVFAAAAALCAVVWTVLTRSFLSIATAGGKAEKVRYVEKTVREKTPFSALLGKEFDHQVGLNYMLNCGLGVLILPVAGVLLLLKGPTVCDALDSVFASIRPGATPVLLCAALCLLSSMIDMATPSVSLEGQSLWIPQSLPVEPKTVLRAKMSAQLILSELPMLFAAVCSECVLPLAPAEMLFVCVLPAVYAAFSAVLDTFLGVRMPVLTWTNELAPIKQSGGVLIALFGGWLVSVVFGGLYFLTGYRLGAPLYLLLWTVLFAAAGLLLLRWLDTRGAETFAAL